MKMNSLTAYQLKIIAIIAMVFDHFIAVFVEHDTISGIALRTPGRVAAPIICYLVAEGYHYTSDRKTYLKRLLLFALISHIPYNLLFGYTFFQATSIMWGLALGLFALIVMKKDNLPIILRIAILALSCVLSITANWSYVSVLWIVGFGLFQGNLRLQIIGFTVIGFVFHLIPTYINFGFFHEAYPHWYQLGIYLAIPILILYNGERGKKSEFMTKFFYMFYPAHLFLLYLLDIFTAKIGFLR